MGSSSKKGKEESKHKKQKLSSPEYEREQSYSTKDKRRKREYSDSDDNKSQSNEDSVKIQRMLDQYAAHVLGESSPERRRLTHDRKSVECSEDETKPIPKPAKKEPEVIVFHTNRKKQDVRLGNRQMAVQSDANESKHPVKCELTDGRLNSHEVLKKIQFDVGSFGMKSLSKEKQREQERQRAMKLGAKAPKRKSVNYKQYMEEQAHKRLKDEDGLEADQPRQKKGNMKSLGQPKFWREGNKSYSPQVGTYRNGVLKLSSKDIKSVKRQR